MKQRGIATCVEKAWRTQGRERARGYHPHGDRKSAEVIENRGDSRPPWRKRVCNQLKTLGLEGCDRRERTCVVY
jgi:hypothetical protein